MSAIGTRAGREETGEAGKSGGAGETGEPAGAVDRVAKLSAELSERLAAAHRARRADVPAEDRGEPAGARSPAPGAAQHGPHVRIDAGSGMSGAAADERQRAHTRDLVRRLNARTPGSRALAQRHRRVLADSRAVVGFRSATKDLLYPLAAREARGSRMVDVDGNPYIDLTMGFGALLLGHEPEPVREAVRRHLAHGLRLGPREALTGEVAELLAELTGAERVAFATTGTEANSAAVRLARAATGRSRVVMFRGSYHGHVDSVLGRPGGPEGAAVPVSKGIPDSAVQELTVLEYGSRQALETIDQLGDSLAAVLVEPVQCRNPGLRPTAFLRTLREITRRHGIVLLFDEMLTGLRPHPRGAQHHFGVEPDLATYGKALGSGFPIGAIAGRADIMDGVDGGFWQYGDDSRPQRETTFFGGTYMQHPLSMVAAHAVLGHLKEAGPGLQEELNQRTDRFTLGLNATLERDEFPLQAVNFGSMFRFRQRADMDLLYPHLLLRGIYIWEWRSCYLSTAHTEEDLHQAQEAVSDALRELRDAGWYPRTRTPARARPRSAPESPAQAPMPPGERPAPDFSISFFGDYPEQPRTSPSKGSGSAGTGTGDEATGGAPGTGDGPYALVLDTARFADRHGFHGVWLPERHFHTFGGIFPNPSVLAAALSRETSRIRLNAGSVVLPLHDPLRVAEEWSVVDNLSGGRVGLGCAVGWHAQDFVLAPDRFPGRRDVTFEHLADLRRLWQGGTVRRPTGEGAPVEVRVQPRPVQKLPPLSLATTGRRESYEQAARHGLGLLTNLMHQDVGQLAENIRHYRTTRAACGLDPDTGRVTVLLHTYLADDHATARAEALEPMCRYLRASLTMRAAATAAGHRPQDVADADEKDLDLLFRRAYDRYCDGRALIGSPESTAPLVDELRRAGVDEIASLVDFGMPADRMRAGLEVLDSLRARFHDEPAAGPAARPAGAPVSGPATPEQRRLWTAAHLAPPGTYNEIQAVRLRGPLDERALRTALDGLVARHPALRTVFSEEPGVPEGPGCPDESAADARTGEPPGPDPSDPDGGAGTGGTGTLWQTVLPADTAVPVALHVSDAAAEDAGAAIRRVLREESERPYDTARGPLFTPRLLRLGARDHVLVLAMHHLVTDGHSARLIGADLQELYRAAHEGRAPLFRRPAGSPLEHTGTARAPRDVEWWRTHLGEDPRPPQVPTDRPRQQTVGRGDAVSVHVDADELAGLQEWSGQQGVTLFATLLTGWRIVLRGLCGQDDFVLGCTFGRRRPADLDTVGFHAGLLPLRGRLTDDQRPADAVRATRDTLLAAARHQFTDLDDLPALRTARAATAAAARPLATVSADLDTDHLAGLDLPGLETEPLAEGTLSAPLELALMAVRTPTGLRLRVRYDADLYEADTVRRMLRRLRAVLRALRGPAACVAELPVAAPEDEAEEDGWCDGGPALPHEPALTAPRPPATDAPLVYAADGTADPGGGHGPDDRAWSGNRVSAAAAALTGRLRDAGVRRGATVALALPRGPQFAAAALGVLDAGACCLPLDLSQPAARLTAVLDDAAPAAVVTREDDPLHPAVHGHPALLRMAAEEGGKRDEAGEVGTRAERSATVGSDPAFLLYTSGSTGRPKGVVLEHRNLAATLATYRDGLAIGPEDRLSWYSGTGFDATALELWPALATGAQLHVVPERLRLDPPELTRWLVERRITVTFVPTPIAEELLAQDWPAHTALRSLVTGGEQLRRRPRPGLPFSLVNIYGPTEAAVFCSWGEVTCEGRTRFGLPSLGRPSPGMRLELRDPAGRPVPAGAVGELHIGGPQVARGYPRDAPATEERFRTDPTGRRWYRTGDLARRRPDGRAHYVGRADDQTQINGVRVEPAEVEAAVRTLDGVRDARVLPEFPGVPGTAAPSDAPDGGRQLLHCHVVPETAEAAAPGAVRGWRRALGELLPGPMVPERWTVVAELPLTPNGKWDRGRTSEAAGARPAADSGHQDAPEDHAETLAALRACWQQVLGVDDETAEQLSDDDSFFAVGGHSISAIRLLNRVRERFGAACTMAEFFAEPTPAALAGRLATRRPRRRAPATMEQMSILRAHTAAPRPEVWNVPTRLTMTGRLDVGALEQAVGRLLARHHALRCRFVRDDGGRWWQEVHEAPAHAPVALPVRDLGGLPGPERETRAEELCRQLAATPFDPSRSVRPVTRLLRLGSDRWMLMLVLHHSSVDAWSLSLLLDELATLYTAAVHGVPAGLPAPGSQSTDYGDLQHRLRDPHEEADRRERWSHYLSGAPFRLELPADRPRPEQPSGRGGTVRLRIPEHTRSAAERLGRSLRTTAFPVASAALAVLLARLSGERDILLNIPYAHRECAAHESMVTCTAMAASVRIRLDEAATFEDLVRHSSARTHEAIGMLRPMFEVLDHIRASGVPDVPERLPIGFAFNNSLDTGVSLPGLETQVDDVAAPAARCDLTFGLTPAPAPPDEQPGGSGYWAFLEYATDRWDPDTARALLASYADALEEACARPTAPLDSLLRARPTGPGGTAAEGTADAGSRP
ncbi:MupA/Atu3671 family FMN-dependent luciferase-like monooxygenase [Streptomyces sp. WMMB303]|uniref:MupA/Atu3671 family FMN-dependent luciferase-like monooxygenase n=1 Tax=Streptomyces sp. WMMB303 TaxID=3034154 RepID=UPI0023EBFF57|nr:MupA/Atu3671 family FMN-dependent luciferase-like monooxygenase [Streptomyces sp. WMMB303]MDF4251731.1 amino acid adenylation domain-containing protein [Streptomyces sp. WMMB303]